MGQQPMKWGPGIYFFSVKQTREDQFNEVWAKKSDLDSNRIKSDFAKPQVPKVVHNGVT
jgi:hypothetical protein